MTQAKRFQQASELHGKGLLESARAVCEEILAVQDRHVEALHLLGVIAAQTQNPRLAVDLLEQAIAIDPHNAVTHCNKGNALQSLRQWDAALASYDKAISLDAGYAIAHNNRGNVLRQLLRRREALLSYDQAIGIKADFVEAHTNRGNVLGELRQWDAALASHDLALALRPDFAEGHCNRGIAQKALDRPEDAMASFDRAIALRPGYCDAHVNRGNVLREMRELNAAITSYDRAIAIQRDCAEAHVNRAVAWLLDGNFERGFHDYEWRRMLPQGAQGRPLRQFSQPLWLGKESLAGKTVLLHDEQGLGDTLQFCRYAALVADLQATVILGVQKPLAAVLQDLAGVTQLVSQGSSLPSFDYHCPLLSLPLALGTTLATIPAPRGYIRPDAVKSAQWKARLARLGSPGVPRIGLTWNGNPNHANDRQRSIPLADMIQHLPRGAQYVSLQKDVRELDRRVLDAAPWILDHSGDLHDFSDTAALCECLDLVITVDTSVAHLSGAMGKRTWILLPCNPDWRWLLERSDTPWYPTATLYRQARSDAWSEVLARVAADLRKQFGGE